ncbi:unnamed protein product [Urochloa humidicola]
MNVDADINGTCTILLCLNGSNDYIHIRLDVRQMMKIFPIWPCCEPSMFPLHDNLHFLSQSNFYPSLRMKHLVETTSVIRKSYSIGALSKVSTLNGKDALKYRLEVSSCINLPWFRYPPLSYLFSHGARISVACVDQIGL